MLRQPRLPLRRQLWSEVEFRNVVAVADFNLEFIRNRDPSSSLAKLIMTTKSIKREYCVNEIASLLRTDKLCECNIYFKLSID